MRLSALATTAAAAIANAAYTGDIVQYWVDQSGLLINGTVIGGIASPPSGWYGAIVQAAIYQAAVQSKGESLAFQQLAVSHAAHNVLIWVFHGTRNYNPTDAALRSVISAIGLDPNSSKGKDAVERGRDAAGKVARARADDGLNDFVDYVHGPKVPDNYQQTPGGNPFPDTPQARFVKTFAGIGDISKFRAPPPPKFDSPEYEADVLNLKANGSLVSPTRSAYDTDTAYFWRESSITGWNRLAHSVVGNSLATKVVESAKFYAQLNYALANAGFAAWDTKFAYDTWRPVTAIQYPGVYLASGQSVTDPDWVPLLRPTPNHPDYPSTHSTYGGAAAAVIRAWNRGSDKVQATLSSNATLDNRGVITRTYTSLREAAEENSASRVFGGIHFAFAGPAGVALGEAVAKETLKKFDSNWDKF